MKHKCISQLSKTMATKSLDWCHLTMCLQTNVKGATCMFICACECAFVCLCVSLIESVVTSVCVLPPTQFLSDKARPQEEAVKIRNLGLCAIYKNQIRALVKLDSATVLRKLNYVDNDALVQLYYLLVLSQNGGKLEQKDTEILLGFFLC